MPLLSDIRTTHSRVGLWKIHESPEELLGHARLSYNEELRFKELKTEKRRLQWLAVRVLYRYLLPDAACSIEYNQLGKPELPFLPFNISISHSDSLAAIQLSENDICGTDVQRTHPKIARLSDKFVHESELGFIKQAQQTEYLTLIWSMKEAVFKQFGSELAFKEGIQLEPFDLMRDDKTIANVNKDGVLYRFELKWVRIEDYFLVYLC